MQVYGNCLTRSLANIGVPCIPPSGRLATNLISYLCLSLLSLQTNTSMVSCRCVQFNSTGIFQSPNFPKPPLPFLPSSSSILPRSLVSQQQLTSCLLYKFIAPDGYIVELTFDYFYLSPRFSQ